MNILVVNCNTSTATSQAIAGIAVSAASDSTSVTVREPSWGVESAEGYYESFISAAAVLHVLATETGDADAVVLAGFGEHGREGARQLLDVPVIDITEAAAMTAMLLSRRYGVVTTLGSTVAGIEDSLLTAGLLDRCTGIRAAEIPVLSIHDEIDVTAELLAAEARVLLGQGADAIVLGCAGMAGLDVALESRLGVPVIDGVRAAIGTAEQLVRMGKRTSKAGPFRAPSPSKARPGWPFAESAVPRPAAAAAAQSPTA